MTTVNQPKNRILAAAVQVFAQKGARQATVEDLLEAAQLSRRTFYRFFRNKEEVLAGLYQVACGHVLSAVRAAADSTRKPMEKLERCVDAYLEFNRSDGELMRVLEGEAMRPDSLLAPLRAELFDNLARVIGESRRADPLLIHGLLLALEGVSQRVHAEGPPHQTTRARLARARRAMLRILLASLAEAGDVVPPLPKK